LDLSIYNLNKNPEISVITACHTHGKYINEMLDSVLAQTFQNFEIIIVNEGSTDETQGILNLITHDKIKVLHTENNGPAAARNHAIHYSKGAIIMNLDADDRISNGLLGKAYDIFTSNPDAGIVYCDAECFGAKTGRFEIGEYTPESMLFDNRIIADAFFRKKDWELAGGYSGELIYGLEDWDFWLKLIEAEKEVVKIPGETVYYRTYKNSRHSRSGRRKNDRMMMIRSLNTIFQRHKKLYARYPDAFNHFSAIEKKLDNENLIIRQIKNYCYIFTKNIRA
jgi:glycosyltransferase involved in cell wall biosynthesis